MKKYILMFLSSMMLVSCLDTIILPDDKTVDEDFWKTKEDVAAMVNGAYQAMASDDVIARLIVWGDYRSDELLQSTTPTGGIPDALTEISAVNMQTTNMYASWSAFYNVINRCNIVLERAAAVTKEDPNYSQGDYLADRSQMLALRALCYFYLVRNYHDVPYITEAYMNSSQGMQVAQSSPEYILDRCIADLEEAERTPLKAVNFTTSQWQRVGWMTEDAIRTLLADIYLWRASVTHSDADYQKCVDYCDLVIQSKKNQHITSYEDAEGIDYPLVNSQNYYNRLFVTQNAEESIFEIQSRSNIAVAQYFFKYNSNTSGEGWLKASSTLFGSAASQITSINANSNFVFTSSDIRYYASCFAATSSGDANLEVRKMISHLSIENNTRQNRAGIASDEVVDYSNDDSKRKGLDSNYPIYRLPDVLLMKAEALVQLVDTTLDANAQAAQLQVPFTLVQAVNTRALLRSNVADSMKWNSYRSYKKDQMEMLVMQERLREFCFEGKRWYDLLRYNYRHVDYVNGSYDELLADKQDGSGNSTLPEIYDNMKVLMTRSRGGDGPGVRAKMFDESYLYLPIPNADIIVCPLLKQNPAYKDAVQYEKNY